MTGQRTPTPPTIPSEPIPARPPTHPTGRPRGAFVSFLAGALVAAGVWAIAQVVMSDRAGDEPVDVQPAVSSSAENWTDLDAWIRPQLLHEQHRAARAAAAAAETSTELDPWAESQLRYEEHRSGQDAGDETPTELDAWIEPQRNYEQRRVERGTGD